MRRLLMAVALVTLVTTGCKLSAEKTSTRQGSSLPSEANAGGISQQGDPIPSPDAPNTPATGGGSGSSDVVDCDKLWNDFVAWNEVGETLTYRSVADTKNIQTITEANAEQVSFTVNARTSLGGVETDMGTTTTTMKRDEYSETCRKQNETPNKGTETITVAAGTYETRWYEIDKAGVKNKSWVATLPSGEQIVVKMDADVNGQLMTILELLETNKK